MCKALNGLAPPSYLSDDYQHVTATGRQQLRSSSVQTFMLHPVAWALSYYYTSERSGLRCCRTAVEQSHVRPLPRAIPLGAKDTFDLLMAAAPCDFFIPSMSTVAKWVQLYLSILCQPDRVKP